MKGGAPDLMPDGADAGLDDWRRCAGRPTVGFRLNELVSLVLSLSRRAQFEPLIHIRVAAASDGLSGLN